MVKVPFETCNSIPRCTFSRCPNMENYYQCSSGECVPLAWRCDFILDCPLADDEFNCSEEMYILLLIFVHQTKAFIIH